MMISFPNSAKSSTMSMKDRTYAVVPEDKVSLTQGEEVSLFRLMRDAESDGE